MYGESLSLLDWIVVLGGSIGSLPLLFAFSRWLEKEEVRADLPPVNRKLHR